ncbi:pyridoxal-dependent decarboxylase [Aspergillus floccosus]
MSHIDQQAMTPTNGVPQNTNAASDIIPEHVLTAIQDHLRDVPNHGSSFFVGNRDCVLAKLAEWKAYLPFVHPFYAVKCNNDEGLLRILANAGISFDCASDHEIRQVLELGVHPERIIFASPRKAEDHILFASESGISLTVFDSEDELRTMAQVFPSARLMLRIRANDPTARVRLSDKFGLELQEAKDMLRLAAKLQVSVVGICFHVGSAASDPAAYKRAIGMTRELYDYNLNLVEQHPLSVIDIGGGFTTSNFRTIAPDIVTAIKLYFGKNDRIRWIAEPGRYFASDAFYLVCRVIGASSRQESGGPLSRVNSSRDRKLFVNDGVYQNFLNCIIEGFAPVPILLDCFRQQDAQAEKFDGTYTIWGQTCCGEDKINKNVNFPRSVQRGDWLCYPSMGAYTLVTASGFNGFSPCMRVIWSTITPQTDRNHHSRGITATQGNGTSRSVL